MASTNVNVVVTAVDKASNVLKTVGANIQKTLSKQAKTDVGGLTQATSGLQGAFGKLAGTAGTVGLAVAGVGAAIAGAYFAAKPFIEASIQMENALMGLNTVARAFGVDADEAKNAAMSLAKDGLMSVSEASAGLKNLLATGFSLPEAINLMNTFKDSASFNRQGMLGFGEAIVGATQGIKNQNSIMVDNAGITKNLSNIIKEQGGSVSDLSQVTSDATTRQRLYNGLMKEGAIFAGDAGKAANTMGGQLSQVATAGFMLKAAIGDALSPAVSMFADVLKGALSGALNFVQKHMFGFQTAVLVVATTLLQAINIIVGAVKILYGAFQSMMTFSLTPLKNAVKEAATSVVATQLSANQKMTDIANKAAGAQTDAFQKSANKIADASNKKKDKVTKDLEKETESFEREMAKREKRFKEQLADMIYAHIEKRDSLIKDLEDENREYADKMADRVKDFKEKMDDMVEAHQEKVDSINEQITEEDTNFEQRMAEKQDNFEEKMADMKDSHEDKVADIEKQIDRETAKGRSADEIRLEDLRAELSEEQLAYEEDSAKLIADLDEETIALQTEHDKRLIAYKAELAKEEEAHIEALAKAKAKEDEETARIIATHAQRVTDYQASIKAEEDILNKHSVDVAAVKDKAKEDDITRLKRQFEEERKEAEDDHSRKLVEIKERGAEEGETMGSSFNAALAPKLGEMEDNFKESGQKAGKNLADGIAKGAKEAASNMVSNFLNGLKENAKAMPKFMWEWTKSKLGLPSIFDVYAETGGWGGGGGGGGAGWQTGGIVPGAVGQPMPVLAHGGEEIVPANVTKKSGNGGGMTFNVTIGIYAGSETEKRNVAKELYGALVQVAQSQNKTVKELMGA